MIKRVYCFMRAELAGWLLMRPQVWAVHAIGGYSALDWLLIRSNPHNKEQ